MKTPVQWGHIIGGTTMVAFGGYFISETNYLLGIALTALGLLVNLVGSELVRVTPKKEAEE
jgi:hypothetical protein